LYNGVGRVFFTYFFGGFIMREITTHKVNGLNEALTVTALDGPGPGGASHSYAIEWSPLVAKTMIQFQLGPIKEVGVNGISIESLLAIVEDRLRSFQSGAFACKENERALFHVLDAMFWLHKRTNDRVARNVEGELKP
jgi:hypothetical protein